MIWEKFQYSFHPSWWNKIKPFIESPECDKIYAKLKEDSKRGVQIAPLYNLTYRTFLETPLNEINVILLGYCPYHTFMNGSPIADGIGFSSSITKKVPPSLEKMYEGLELELNNGLNLGYYKNPDLLYWARQGIFLLNSSLTTAKDKAGSHQELWKPFTQYLIENVFAYTGIPIVLIGKDAQFYERYMTPLTHGQIFKIEHPSFAARNQAPWETKDTFKKVNTIVKQNNGFNLKWLCNEDEIEEILNNELPF